MKVLIHRMTELIFPQTDLFKTERVTKISKVRFSNIVNEMGGSFDINNPAKLFRRRIEILEPLLVVI